MTSKTPDLPRKTALSGIHRICVVWIGAMAALAVVVLMDVDNIMVHEDKLDHLIFWTRMSAIITAVCGFALALREHQTHELPHFGKMIAGYVAVVLSCATIGAAAAYGGLPRVSLLWTQTEMSVPDTLYKVSSGAMDRRARRRFYRRWAWHAEHPNNEIYDLYLDDYFDPYLRRQQVSVANNQGERLWNSVRGGPSHPKLVLLHGVGNGYAMRVFEFTVLDGEDNA